MQIIWVELSYFMLVSNMLPYVVVDIMLALQDMVIIIFTLKSKTNNIAFTIKDNFEGLFN